MFHAADWDSTFLPAVRAWLSGGDPLAYIYNPPWVLVPLVPFALAPYTVGRIALFVCALAVFVAVALRVFHARTLGVVALMASPLALDALAFGNVEWLALLGLLLPTWAAIPFLLIKPHIGAGVAALLVYLEWRERGWKHATISLTPTICLTAISFVVFGDWVAHMATYTQFQNSFLNLSFFPYTLPLGLALFVAAIRTRRIEYALVCAPCFFPVLTPQVWVVALVAIVGATWETCAASLGLWLVVAMARI